MPTNQGLISFNNPDDWELITNVTKQADAVGTNSYIPLESLDLSESLDSYYIAAFIAALVTVNYLRPRWDFAGELSQVYDFEPSSDSPSGMKLAIQGTPLVINKLELINTAKVSRDAFSLRYTPPDWFRDYTLVIYKYTGEIENDIETAFTDIATNITCNGANVPTDLNEQLENIVSLVQSTEARLCEKLEMLNKLFNKCTETPEGVSRANGVFKPKTPQDNIVNAYFKGFL